MASMRKHDTSIAAIAALLAIAATPTFNPSVIPPAVAQAPAPPAFPVPDSVAKGTTVKVDVSPSMTGINDTLKQQFEQKFPETKVEVTSTDANSALQALREGKIDVAAISRPLTEAEKSQGLAAVQVARNKIALFVGQGNSFQGTLTSEQFAKIFRGEITDWAQVEKGKSGPVKIVDRPATSDIRQGLPSYPVFQTAPFQPGGNAVTVGTDSTAEVIKNLGNDGLGYAVYEQVKDQPGIRILEMFGTFPSDPLYPFSQPLLYIYNRANPSPAAKAFLGYVEDPGNKGAIESARSAAAIAATGGAAPVPATPAGAMSPSNAGGSGQGQPSASPSQQTPVNGPTDGKLSAGDPSKPTASPSGTAWWQPGAGEGRSGDIPWIWGLLAFPILAGGLWWLLKDRGGSDNGTSASRSGAGGVVGLPSFPAGTADLEVANGPSLPPLPAPDLSLPPLPNPVGTSAVGGTAAVAVSRLGGAVAGGQAASSYPGTFVGEVERDGCRVVLMPRTSRDAYAHWDIPEDKQVTLRREGRQLALRLCDVTGGIDIDQQQPHKVKQFPCPLDELAMEIPIERDDRDYLVELGYTTDDNRWVRLARSEIIHVPKVPTSIPTVRSTPPSAVGSTVLPNPDGTRSEAIAADPNNQIILVPRSSDSAYVYWSIPEEQKDLLRMQGGQRLALRLYDVTGVDLEQQAPHSVQQFDCAETDRDQLLPIRLSERDYLVELGYVSQDGHWLRLARSYPARISGSLGS